ncbi:mechanosensitive ion channel family protein [Sphingomonas sp. H39-1-10]|uniref:mechanosensitive ion channel family protein n=1 Tax=Sphingomonas pollutisoli TaxID=3030829 RepID=UPI0023B95444|nr:mechanosensitive ion channel family protein [Sphingomonas pollutisoli]MDF0487437.1 mechanosensitive ion channel family protein [Sphingomonas pollutisoli]
MSNTTKAILPPVKVRDINAQLRDLVGATVDWLATHWLQILIALAIGAVIVIALATARKLGQRLCSTRIGIAGWGTVLGRAVVKTNNFFIVMVAAKLVQGYAGAPPEVATTIRFLFTIASVFQVAIWAREIILGAIEHRTHSENYSGEALQSAMGIISLLVTFAVFAIAFIVVLDNLGVNVTGLVAGLGVGGIAIGLAAQGIFADLFAALAILFDRPFKRGDQISFGDSSGVIESIGLKSTRIRAYTGEERVIANKNLLDKEILNVSQRNHIRIGFTLGVAYETPHETLEQLPGILKELIQAEGATVARAGFESFGASTLDFAVQFDTAGNDWATAHATRDRLLVTILRRFAKEGISLAYPTQTTFTAAPDGTLIMPYPDPQKVERVDGEANKA